MKALFGIGNVGSEYSDTRHNIGFIILDAFAQKHKLDFAPGKGDFYFAKGTLREQEFILIKPTTYVNRSGIAASEVLNQFNIPIDSFLVITDDINLDVGKIRLRPAGGDGGHNGLASIIYYLERTDFPRLRFGIGNNFPKGEMANYVLSPFEEDELEIIAPSIQLSVELLESFIIGGLKGALDYLSKHGSKNVKKEDAQKKSPSEEGD